MYKSIITLSTPKSPISEAYRVIRTNLQFTSLDTPVKVIIVTSSGPTEGKSTTIVNLAVTFAQSGLKTLLMDCDLRKPRISKIFGLSNRFGTTNAIVDPGGLQDYVQNTEVEGLDVLTSGPVPPNPSELLGSNKMKNLLAVLKESYDIVLMDSPPVGMVTDAQVLSTLADGTILVAGSGQVTIDALKRSKELLQNVNARILGVIVNKLGKDSKGYNYNYYYENYENGTDSRGRKKKRRQHKQ